MGEKTEYAWVTARRGVCASTRAVVDFMAPPKCLTCHAPVSEPAALCMSCWTKLHFIESPVCDALGIPFDYDPGVGTLSAAALAEPPPWDRSRAAVAFDEYSRPLVHALKYRDTMEAGLFMARLMARAGRDVLHTADVLVPVPLNRWRLWRRRFNQAAFLAQKLGQVAGRPYRPDVLLRPRYSKSQVGLGRDERRKNVGKAFAVDLQNLNHIAGKRILLIDDVRTTGATAASCVAILLKAGAASVDVLTFALVLEPLRPHIG